MVLRV